MILSHLKKTFVSITLIFKNLLVATMQKLAKNKKKPITPMFS
jgi:hypothetical protein